MWLFVKLLHNLNIKIRKLRSKDSSKLHIQLCAAMFCMFVVFLFGIGLDKAGEEDFGISIDKTQNIGGCVVVSVLIHYFTLVTFMVMAAESLLMFQKLVVVFVQITTPYLVMTSILCWCKCLYTFWLTAISYSPPLPTHSLASGACYHPTNH